MRYAAGEVDDPRKKNVDSGRVAVLYASDSSDAFSLSWSGSSKERRRTILERLSAELTTKELRVKVTNGVWVVGGCEPTWEDSETPPVPVGIFSSVSLDVCVGSAACTWASQSGVLGTVGVCRLGVVCV